MEPLLVTLHICIDVTSGQCFSVDCRPSNSSVLFKIRDIPRLDLSYFSCNAVSNEHPFPHSCLIPYNLIRTRPAAFRYTLMSRQELPPPKRPIGARTRPTRPFSFDSDGRSKRNLTDSASALDNDQGSSQGRLHTSSVSAQHVSQESFTKDRVQWTDGPMAESSHQSSVDDLGSLKASAPKPPVAKRSFSSGLAQEVRKPSISSSSDQPPDHTDSAPIRTPSKVRWEQLRQHVVQSTIPLPASPTPSSQTLNPGSPVPSTPKASRFARLGLRQVVDHVREAAVDDFRMLADDILKVCWSPRLPDARIGTEREISISTVGPSPHLALVSNSSIGTSTTLVHPSDDPQLPVSTFLTRRNATQVLVLHEIILRYASRNASFLPHEHMVHATLLKPFLPHQAKHWTEGELCTAVEAFEAAVKLWRPASAEVSFILFFSGQVLTFLDGSRTYYMVLQCCS